MNTDAGRQVARSKFGRVAVATLDAPARRNALNTRMMAELAAFLNEAEADVSTRAILLTGTAPAFCAGSDMIELAGLTFAEMCQHEAETAAVVRRLSAISRPVVAAVEGYALGGGCILAAACDVVITSRSARWHLPEVTNGWFPPWGLSPLIARTGLARARELVFGLTPLNGDEACAAGLADRAVEPGDARGEAMKSAEALAALSPEAAAATKSFFRNQAPDAVHLDETASQAFAASAQSDAARATLEKYSAKR